jgi:hypothetical protein
LLQGMVIYRVGEVADVKFLAHGGIFQKSDRSFNEPRRRGEKGWSKARRKGEFDDREGRDYRPKWCGCSVGGAAEPVRLQPLQRKANCSGERILLLIKGEMHPRHSKASVYSNTAARLLCHYLR